MTATATLSIVEVYPYVPYIQYLLPGTIVLAIFVSAVFRAAASSSLMTRPAARTKAISSPPSGNLN